MSFQSNNNYSTYMQNNPNGINQGPTTNYGNNSISNQGSSFRSTPSNIKQQDAERHRMLLQNIQSQMNLNKPTKLQELQKRKEEDQKYIQDMQNCFPFGRGGGGAPIRDKNGSIVTSRRGLISNPKYNLMQINVDDDYNEVWDKGIKYGLLNYKNTLNRNNSNNGMNVNSNFSQTMGYNNNNNNNGQYGNNFLANTAQRSLSARIYGNNNNNNMNNGISNAFNYGISNGMNGNFQQQQQPPQFDGYGNNDMNQQQMYNNGMDNNNYLQNDQQQYFNYNGGIDMNQQQNLQPQFISNTPPPNNNNNAYQQGDPNFNYNNTNINGQPELNLSYDNYEINDYQKQRTKETYRNDLLQQIAEKKQRELLEKQRREKEEREEEERLKREQEELERKKEAEQKRQKNDARNKLTTYQPDPVIVAPTTNQVKQVITPQTISPPPEQQPERQFNSNESLYLLNQEEMQKRLAINNEMLKLREQMEQQQASLYEQINSLRQETQDANMQRYEALQEIDKLKNELNKQRSDEELRRKYIYDVVGNKNENGIVSHTHLPESTIEKIDLPVQDPKNMYYEETMRHPNKILPLPNLNELKENGIKTDSQFIDMDSHNMVSGLELFEPKVNVDESLESKDDLIKINNKGFSVEGDFGTLRSYYKSDNDTIKESNDGNNDNTNTNSNNTNINRNSLEDVALEINQIYNKNIERLRFLNDIEGKIKLTNVNQNQFGNDSNETVDNIVKENYDDFINKINQTCNPQY